MTTIITDTKCPFFTQITRVPQGSTEAGLSWLVIMDILLTMVKLHDLSDIFIPDANHRLFRQYVIAIADDIKRICCFPKILAGTSDDSVTVLYASRTRDSPVVARGCYTDKKEDMSQPHLSQKTEPERYQKQHINSSSSQSMTEKAIQTYYTRL